MREQNKLNIYIGQQIKKYRQAKNMTADDLAKKVGVSRATITRYETGTRGTTQNNLFALARVLGVTVDDFFPDRHQANPEFTRIPIIGSIACGEPILAEQNIDGYTDQAFMRQTSDGLFALRCKGKSMEPTIPDGSIVVIHQQPIVEDGEIAAVQMHSEGADTDEATLKRVKHVGGHVLLMPDNQAYDPIVVDKNSGARIIGKAIRIEIEL